MTDPDTEDDYRTTSDEQCNCGTEVDTGRAEREHRRQPQETTAPNSDTPLPEALRRALGEFLGDEAVDTLGEWADECRRRTGGGAITAEDLCYADGETSHWGTLAGERHYFQCFYDAVVLSALVDEPVEIHTEGPDGTTIRIHADGTDEVSVTPETTVFSFGIESEIDRPADLDPTIEDVYAAVCPYVRAFPDREAYENWADTVPAVTVALPPDETTALAERLVETR